MIYFLGIGSNITPYQHIPKILDALFSLSDTLTISRIIETEPKGLVNPSGLFLNLVATVKTELSASLLKAQLNEIEITLGRNRTDPDKKIKDRVADIDILFTGQSIIPATHLPDEPYLRPMALELLQVHPQYQCTAPLLPLAQGQSIQLHDQAIGTSPIKLTKLSANSVNVYQLETRI